MNRRVAIRLVALAALAFVGACVPKASVPVDPHWGKQPCGHCAMLVSTPRYAAQGVRAAGERLYFDDVGCLVTWERDHHEAFTNAWAHDEGTAWLPLETVRFRAGESTPMDFGFAAVATGEGVTFEAVRAAVLAHLAELERNGP
jgi:copper chaperone NosL